MKNKFSDFLSLDEKEEDLDPLFIITNTNDFPYEGGALVKFLFFLSKRKVKNNIFYYFYYCLANAKTSERFDSKFDIGTDKELPSIIAAIKTFLNSLSDKEINVYSFSKCKITQESAQELLEKILSKEIV